VKKTVLCCGLLLSPLAAFADGSWSPGRGNLSLYGDYSSLNVTQGGDTLTPNGGGGGVHLLFNLRPNFFVDGSYQYNSLHDSVQGFGYGVKFDQGRAGGGMVFHVPQQPLDVYGKVEYVHFGNQITSQGVTFDPDNDDGVGYHLGFRTRGPYYQLYASGGWLQLADNSGAEALAGVEVPFAPFVHGFAEYRWDYLKDNTDADANKLRINDYRLGVRWSF